MGQPENQARPAIVRHEPATAAPTWVSQLWLAVHRSRRSVNNEPY